MGKFPKRIDINPTAKCNLQCNFCWGPDHGIPDGLNTQDWKNIINFFSSHGTNEIVFTGGEPLIRQDLSQLLQHSKLLGMRVTLSTNTLLLNEKKAVELLPYIDEIGIPIDGSDPQKNSKIRIPFNPSLINRHFLSVMEALLRVRRLAPDLEITIRTVVSRVNQDDIVNIGELLHRQKENWNRWKLYQFTPVSIGAKHKDEHNMPSQTFKEIGRKICSIWPDSYIRVYSSDERISKYVFLGPEGSIFGVGDDVMYKRLGIFQEMKENDVIEAVHSLTNL